MTKLEMAEQLVNHPLWDGKIKDADRLCDCYSLAEIQDMYDEMDLLDD